MQRIRYAKHKENTLASFIPFEVDELERGNLENAILDLMAMLCETRSEDSNKVTVNNGTVENVGKQKDNNVAESSATTDYSAATGDKTGTSLTTPETLAQRYKDGNIAALVGDSIVAPTELTYPISDLFRYLKLCECSATDHVKIGSQVISIELVEKYILSDITYSIEVPLLALLQACSNTRSLLTEQGETASHTPLTDEEATADKRMVLADEIVYSVLMCFYSAVDPSFKAIFFPQYYHDLATTDAAVFGLAQFIAMRGYQQQEQEMQLTLDLFYLMNCICDPIINCLWQQFLAENQDVPHILAEYGYDQQQMFLNLPVPPNMEQWFATVALLDFQELFTSVRLNNVTTDYDMGCALFAATVNATQTPPELGDLLAVTIAALNLGEKSKTCLLKKWDNFYDTARRGSLLNGQRVLAEQGGDGNKPFVPCELEVTADIAAKNTLIDVAIEGQRTNQMREFVSPALLRSALIRTTKTDVSNAREVIITDDDINVWCGGGAGNINRTSGTLASQNREDEETQYFWLNNNGERTHASNKYTRRLTDVASTRWPIIGKAQNEAILDWLKSLNINVPEGMCPLLDVGNVDAVLAALPNTSDGKRCSKNKYKYDASLWLFNEVLPYALTEDAVRAIALDVLTDGVSRTLDVEFRRSCELTLYKFVTGEVPYTASANATNDSKRANEQLASRTQQPDGGVESGYSANDTDKGNRKPGKIGGIIVPSIRRIPAPQKITGYGAMNGDGTKKAIDPKDEEFGEIKSPTWSPKSIRHLRTLCAFATDLTVAAHRGEQGQNILCRDGVIDDMVTVLTRREKSNPILLAPAGTGKTAIVEGLAHKIVTGEIPSLVNTRVLALDVMGILAKSASPTLAAATIKKALSEAAAGNVTIFIDEIHIIGGDTHRDSALANAMKPLLARPGLRVIGATTEKEYNASIGHDKALQRRFSPMHVPVLTFNEVVEVLDAKRGEYGKHHGVEYDGSVSTEIALLASAYLGARPSPDRELDVMDVSGSYARKRGSSAVADEDIIAAVKMLSSNRDVHTKQELARNALSDDETILNMFPRVAGQREAKIAVGRSIVAGQLGLTASDKPRAVLLFAGPSGVGKTYLAREMASAMNLNADDDVLVVPLSEFVTEADYTKLIGTGPQWVGYNDGGMLTNFIAAHPSGIVVLDEFDLCDEAVSKLFMGIFDTGRVKNGSGDTIDARQVTFVCTTNIGYTSETMKRQIGFVSSTGGSKYDGDAVRETLRNTFGIAMMSRFSDVILFDDLSDDDKVEACRVKWNDYAELVGGRFGVRLEDVFPWRETEERVHSIINEVGGNEANVRVIWGLLEREIASRVMSAIASDREDVGTESLASNDTKGESNNE